MIQSAIPEEQRDAASKLVAEIRGGTARVSAIVRDLHTFAQDRAPEEEVGASADIAEVLATVKRLVAHEVDQRARLTVDVPPLPQVASSTRRLEQVELIST